MNITKFIALAIGSLIGFFSGPKIDLSSQTDEFSDYRFVKVNLS